MNSILRKTTWAGIAYCAMSAIAHAAPIAADSVTLSKASPIAIFEIDATGFENLTLEGSMLGHGPGMLDPCDGRTYYDCLDISAGGVLIYDDLSAYSTWTDFGPASLSLADTFFDLAFEARISGGDEFLTIEWQVFGDPVIAHDAQEFESADSGSTSVPEPGSLALLGLGLGVMGLGRRRMKK